MRFRSFAVILCCLPVLAVLPARSAQADEAPLDAEPRAGVEVEARYASSVLIFRVGEIELEAVFGAERYAAQSRVTAVGLAALFTDFDIRSEVRGRPGEGPLRYAHVERTGDKVRSVSVDFGTGVAQAVAEPPFGSLGQPPASAEERTGVIDPMTAFFELSRLVAANGEAGCVGRLSVFDGKQRYDLRLEDGGAERIRTRAWRGEARLCRAWYEPVSGYDPEDYPSESELRHPLEVWLAEFPEAGVHLPVRIFTRAGFGGITIEASELAIRSAPPAVDPDGAD